MAENSGNSNTNHGQRVGSEQRDRSGWFDPTDHLAPNYSVELYHVPTGASVKFKGFVTSFTDSYSSNWNTEEAYGRMDPITTFQNTARTINIEWDVIAAHESEAKNNMAKCESLFRMLYPTYISGDDSAGSIASAPLFKVKFGNLISKAGSQAGADAASTGLLGTLGGFEYSPDFDAGFFLDAGAMFPQTISLAAEMQVIHNFPVGWDASTNSFRTKNYPYGRDDGQAFMDEFINELNFGAPSQATPQQSRKAENAMTNPGKGAKVK
tara:strand:+ start:243 stop:1043 length:801 start_codon:yes stop_codon:yes gene_type:complete